MMHNLYESLLVEHCISPKTISNTTENGSSVDAKDAQEVLFVFAFGSINTGADVDLKIQDSADNSTWADVSGSALAIADTADNKTFAIRVSAPRHARYLRPVAVEAATQNCLVSCIAAITKRDLPVTQENTGVDVDGLAV